MFFFTLCFYKKVCSLKCLFFSRMTFCTTFLLLGPVGTWRNDFSRGRGFPEPLKREATASLCPKTATKSRPVNKNVPSSLRWNPWSLPWRWSWKHHQQCEEWSQKPGAGGLQGDLLEVFYRACSTTAKGETGWGSLGPQHQPWCRDMRWRCFGLPCRKVRLQPERFFCLFVIWTVILLASSTKG